MRKTAIESSKILKITIKYAIFVKADVTKKSDIQAVVDKALTTYDQIDILYNGAGIHDDYDNAVELEEDFYDQLMAINVKAPYLAAKMVIPHFIKQGGGTVINVGSQATQMAGPGGSAYVTSKHAIFGSRNSWLSILVVKASKLIHCRQVL